jgi:hypothetical protein
MFLIACFDPHRRPPVLPASPPRALHGVWGHEALRACAPRASDGDWVPNGVCLASIDERVRRAAFGRTVPEGAPLDRLYLPYTLRGRRYVLAMVYPTDGSFDGRLAHLPFVRASAAVPAACGATDGGGLVFEETYVVGSSAGEEGLEVSATTLASCAGENGVTWQTACAAYEAPDDGTILYADPCTWYYDAPPPDAVAPGRYDRAALAEARKLVQDGQDIYGSAALLTGLSELCERRCTRAARGEIWELHGAMARRMGWHEGARRAFAEAARLRAAQTGLDEPLEETITPE